jgi:valyl-tRNA synthetase
MGILEKYGSDAARYWAASGRPGTDTIFEESQMKIGRRLAIKLLNASKFALGVPGADGDTPAPGAVHRPLDRALLAALADLVTETTMAFDDYDYARALDQTERLFWRFCDDYVELVKQRAYDTSGDAATSASATLVLALDTLLRLFAPHLPFVTEEVWSWWRPGSVHRSPWPDPSALRDVAGAGDPEVFTAAADVLGQVRKVKSEHKRSLRTTVLRLTVTDTAERVALLDQARDDLREAARADALDLVVGTPARVDVELAPPDAA